jgi:hypothetical protein
MGARGFVFFLLLFPILYVILLVSDLLVIVYDPLLRISTITFIGTVYTFYSFRKNYTKRQNDYLENLSLLSAKIGETEYFYTTEHNQKANLTTITTYIEGIYGYDFSLKFEGQAERFFKSIGLSTECQSGDTRFDETVYIVSDDEWLCTQLKSTPEFRKLFLDIFWCCHDKDVNVRNIQCFDGRILITSRYSTKQQNEEFVREYTRSIASLLQQSLAFLPSKGTIKDKIYRESTGYIAHILHVFILALLANGAIIFFTDMTTVQIMPHLVHSLSIIPLTLKSTFIFIALLMITAFFFLYRSSRLAPVAIQILSLGLLGTFLTSLVEIKEINSRFDISEAQIYKSQITGKEAVHHRKSGTTYHLYFRPWEWQGSSFDLVVPYSLYTRSNEGDIARIYEHRGYLGYAWIENIEITPSLPEKIVQDNNTSSKEEDAFWDKMVILENNSTNKGF